MEFVYCFGDGFGWLSMVVLVVFLVVVVIVIMGGCVIVDGGGSIFYVVVIYYRVVVESGYLYDGDGEEVRCVEEDDCFVYGCGWLVDRIE